MPGLEDLSPEKPSASAPSCGSDSLSQGTQQSITRVLAVIIGVVFGTAACMTQLSVGQPAESRAFLSVRRAASHRAAWQRPRRGEEPTPAVLAHILMMTGFHWDSTHLSWLAQVIKNVDSYPTRTDFAISTNAPDKLEEWRKSNTLGAGAFRVHAAVNTTPPYGLTWAHRDIVDDALANGDHTAFMYMEDDDFLSWSALLSWADDQAPLAALGFMRSFARVETSPDDAGLRDALGRLMMLDGRRPVNISSYDRKVTLARPGCGVDGRACDFIALPNPYSSMWLLSRERLQHCIETPWWRRETIPRPHGLYGPSEMAANSVTLADVPAGFFSSAVVPYDLSAGTVLKTATVAHLPNKYCTHAQRKVKDYCTVPFENFIVS